MKNVFKRCITFIIVIINFGSVAQASLISKDLLTQDDGLITQDSQTQLEWLDLSATNEVSVVDILNGYGGYYDKGFRYASESQVLNLYINAGFTNFNPDPFYRTSGVDSFIPAETLISLMGCTFTCENTPDSFPFGHRPVARGSYGTFPSLDNIENRPFRVASVAITISDVNSPEQEGFGSALIGNQSGLAQVAFEGTGSFLVREASLFPSLMLSGF